MKTLKYLFWDSDILPALIACFVAVELCYWGFTGRGTERDLLFAIAMLLLVVSNRAGQSK